MRSIPLTLLFLLALPLAAQTELRLAVGITPAQNIFNRIQAPLEKATGLKLVLTDARSPAAWALLQTNQVEAASGGLTWEEWKQSIAAKGQKPPLDTEVTVIQIGTDQIQVVTSPDTPLLELDKEQLQAIFSGQVRNWKAVGGDDAPITVLLDPAQLATNNTFRTRILGAAPYGPSAWSAQPGTSLLQAVAATPHAIGFAPKASQESLKVNSPMTPEISRPILLLIKGSKPSDKVRKLLDYLRGPEGAKLVIH